MQRIILGLSDWADRAARAAAALSLVLMILLLAVQVVARYLFRDPPAWTEEAARYAMVWAGFLGAAMAFRAGSDPVLMKLKQLQHGALALVARLLRDAAVLLFILPVGWYCVFGPNMTLARGFIARSLDRATESLGMSLGWITISLPLALLLILIHLIAGYIRPADSAKELP